MGARYFGAAVKRVEDPGYLRGEARYVVEAFDALGLERFAAGSSSRGRWCRSDAAEALGWFGESGFWKPGALTTRPLLYVL